MRDHGESNEAAVGVITRSARRVAADTKLRHFP
jgi:hypothetical protein